MSKLALSIIKENIKTKSPILDLRYTGIKNWIKEIETLTHVDELILGNSFMNIKTKKEFPLNRKDSKENIILSKSHHQLPVMKNINRLHVGFLGGYFQADFIKKFPNIELLDIRCIHRRNSFLAEFPNIKHLIIGGGSINPMTQEIINLKKLETLIVTGTSYSINPPKISGIFASKYLKKIDFGNNTKPSNLDSLINAVNLESLIIESGRVKEIPDFFMKFKSLKHLHIFNRISSRKIIRNVSNLSNCTQLTYLFLHGGTINNVDQDLSFLNNLTALKKLRLKNIGRLSKNATELQQLDQLEHIILENTRIEHLNSLRGKVKLKSIHLEEKNLKDISFLSELPSLESAHIEYKKLDDYRTLIPLFEAGINIRIGNRWSPNISNENKAVIRLEPSNRENEEIIEAVRKGPEAIIEYYQNKH